MYTRRTKALINGFGDNTPNLLLTDSIFVPTLDLSCPTENKVNFIPGATLEPVSLTTWQNNMTHTTQNFLCLKKIGMIRLIG